VVGGAVLAAGRSASLGVGVGVLRGIVESRRRTRPAARVDRERKMCAVVDSS
jgi:hypothetical protein